MNREIKKLREGNRLKPEIQIIIGGVVLFGGLIAGAVIGFCM